VLTSNTYDQALAGYYNVGRLTTSTNSSATRSYAYTGGGSVYREGFEQAAGNHWIYNVRSPNGAVLWKSYYPGSLSVGDTNNRWTYDGADQIHPGHDQQSDL
jgi:hypothetical protein